MAIDNFNAIIRAIRQGALDPFSQDQLVCMAHLVFHNGLSKAEIINLLVENVIESKGNLTRSIKTPEGEIILTEASNQALRDYLKTPKIRHLKLLKRKNPLFPGFRNAKKLERAWKVLGTRYSQILDWGINSRYLMCRDQGMQPSAAVTATADHFRHSRRSISAHITGKPIRPGNFDVTRESMKLLEQAGLLKRDDPDLIMKSDKIIEQFGKIEKIAQSPAQKREIETMRPFIFDALSPFLGK